MHGFVYDRSEPYPLEAFFQVIKSQRERGMFSDPSRPDGKISEEMVFKWGGQLSARFTNVHPKVKLRFEREWQVAADRIKEVELASEAQEPSK